MLSPEMIVDRTVRSDIDQPRGLKNPVTVEQHMLSLRLPHESWLARQVRAQTAWLIRFSRVLAKRDDILTAANRHHIQLGHVLNIGSKNVRIGTSCTNLDIVAGDKVDVVGDAHDLQSLFPAESFDTVVMSAVLQYCKNPGQVIRQAHHVLRPDGILLLDAPFIQPYCVDGTDLWRFTADGLRTLCEPYFAVLEVTTSIGTGPAIAFIAQSAARTVRNRVLAAALACLVGVVGQPLRFFRHSDQRTAGAFLLIGRKLGDKACVARGSLTP